MSRTGTAPLRRPAKLVRALALGTGTSARDKLVALSLRVLTT
ncbi:hypothetical protein [Nocardia sp. NPDC004750]